MQYLYVCLFSNGHIKAGRSINPESRIASHESRVSCLGVELVEHRVFACSGHVAPAEAEMLRRCEASSEKVHKNEWFVGLDFLDACAYAEQSAEADFKEINKSTLKTYLGPMTTEQKSEFAKSVGTTIKHLVNVANGYKPLNPAVCVSIERVTSGNVTRRELRPDDYWLIWPDLPEPIQSDQKAKTPIT